MGSEAERGTARRRANKPAARRRGGGEGEDDEAGLTGEAGRRAVRRSVGTQCITHRHTLHQLRRIGTHCIDWITASADSAATPLTHTAFAHCICSLHLLTASAHCIGPSPHCMGSKHASAHTIGSPKLSAGRQTKREGGRERQPGRQGQRALAQSPGGGRGG